MKNLRSRALLCSSRRPWRKHLQVNGFTNSSRWPSSSCMLHHRYWCNENLSSWMQTSIDPMDLSFQCSPKSRSLHQLEENKYPKMPNILRNYSRWCQQCDSNYSSTISTFLQGWLGYLTKHCGISKDLMPSLFPENPCNIETAAPFFLTQLDSWTELETSSL